MGPIYCQYLGYLFLIATTSSRGGARILLATRNCSNLRPTTIPFPAVSGDLARILCMSGGCMDLSFDAFHLTLSVPFTIARGTQTVANNVRVCLQDGEMHGLG